MEIQEWKEYVQKVTTWDVPLPMGMVSNMDDWKCRSIVGRSLLMMKDVEGAMNVLATVREIEPNMDDAPEFGFSEAEHMVLCLRDLAEIIWMLTGTGDAPAFYLKRADKICREYKHVFRAADRGKIWVRRLELMRSCGLEAEALSEASAVLEAEKAKLAQVSEASDWTVNLEPGANPYIFRALIFMAEGMAAKEEYSKAALLIEDAYAYYPCTEATRKDLAEAKAAEEPAERYAKLLHCTTIPYQPWERDNIPTLEDVHRLQEENFLKREAAKAGGGVEGTMDLMQKFQQGE